ncbi:CHASE3 domain-containing protein [Leptolyngbya sp. FACHB-17]|uniref:sensor histidine kinase n=1 Tax=Leptolyngbyales TaxID=3079749 RepID=UPI00241167A7|nr:CHASE3 domain-containing protein [Leptolyngbya sp. FACHB-17]
MPNRTQNIATFGAAFILLAAGSLASCLASFKSRDSSQWVSHTNEVLAKAESVLSEVKDAETGQRGFLLTQKTRYLQPYYDSVRQASRELQDLQSLTRDNPRQQARIQQLQPLISAKFLELKQTVDLNRAQGLTAALAVVQTDQGQALMDQIRAVTHSIQQEEIALLHQRIQQANQDATAATASIVLLSVSSIGLVGTGLRRTSHYITTLKQLETRLRTFNQELDEQVESQTQKLLDTNTELRAKIQERQQINIALNERNEQFYSTFNQAAVGIAHVSPAGRWLQVNDKLCKIVGYRRDELLQKTFQDLTYPDDLNTDLNYVQQMLANKIQTYSIEKRYIRKDGSLIWVNLTVSLVRTDHGVPKYFISVIEDISQRKRAEEEIQQLNVTLEQRVIRRTAELTDANQELQAFTSTISHDLRSPLTTMKGLAQALLEDYSQDLNEEGQTYTQLIWDSAQRLDALTQDLLNYSRLSQSEVALRPVNLDQLIRQILLQMQLELQTSQAQVKVDFPLPEVIAHSTLLTQVITNLLANAIKFVAPNVQPNLHIWSEEKEDWVRVWIADNGIGIKPEAQEQIFGIFERLHSAETYPGTGMGLAIVRRGVERMEGRVGVESQPGKGSQFWLELKRANSS